MRTESNQPGRPIILSAPSGGGKSTIAEELLRRHSRLKRSISCTTRDPRPGEVNGQHYFFISPEEFKTKINNGEFVEWAMVHNNFYGTPRDVLETWMKGGIDVLLVIDPQGAESLRKIYPQGLYVFITPPTWDELRIRLEDRGSDNKNVLKVRLENAKKELSYLPLYDHVVINDDLEKAVHDVDAYITGQQHKARPVNKDQVPIFQKMVFKKNN